MIVVSIKGTGKIYNLRISSGYAKKGTQMSMTIYFATNRKPNKSKPTDFGKSAGRVGNLRFGLVKVKKGLMDSGSIRMLPDNPKQGSKKMFADLRSIMKTDSADSLLFIHGFNVSFKKATESAAAMGKMYLKQSDNNYRPNIFVFSWPSDGKLLKSYSNDRYDAENSGYAFVRGMMKLSEFLRHTDKKSACSHKIHLIAHSMGNYVLRHALQQAQKISGGKPLTRLFDDIILTAADEDSDTFEHTQKLARLPDLAQRITVYFNTGDMALKISDYTKGNPDRLGHDGPNKPHDIPAKIVLVDASAVVTGLTEHLYHQDDEIVASDIVSLLQGDSSEQIKNRQYVAHANKYKLLKPDMDGERIDS